MQMALRRSAPGPFSRHRSPALTAGRLPAPPPRDGFGIRRTPIREDATGGNRPRPRRAPSHP